MARRRSDDDVSLSQGVKVRALREFTHYEPDGKDRQDVFPGNEFEVSPEVAERWCVALLVEVA
jgi:hypothetical protein